MSYFGDPVHWRNRARALRLQAEQTENEVAKEMILSLAEDRDRRGDRAEERPIDPRSSSIQIQPIEFGSQLQRRQRRAG